MDAKKVIWFGAIAGSILGGCVPNLWHASSLSLSGLVWSTLGGLLGIFLGYRLSR